MSLAARNCIFVPILFLFFAMPASPAAESAVSWLNKAADSRLSLRERDFAARQTLMLVDDSASILIGALRGNDSDNGLRRQVAAGLLGEFGRGVSEAPLLEAVFGSDFFLSNAASAALARVYSRLDDDELHGLIEKGGPRSGTLPGGIDSGGDDWLALSLDVARTQGRFRAIVMSGLELKYGKAARPMPEFLTGCVWDGLADADPELRLHSLGAAARTASGEAAGKVAAFLYAETTPRLLIRALRAMGEMRSPDYAMAAGRHVRHADPLVAIEALAALDAMGHEQTMFPAIPGGRSVAAYVAHPSTPVRRRAIELLGESRNPAALEFLVAALFDRVGQNRAAAAKALGELGFTGAVGGLSPLLNDTRPEVRAEAAVALAKLGVVGIAARVTGDLENGALPFRRAAAEALGRIGDGRAIPFLLAGLSDSDSELACLAAESLGKLRKREAGAGLFEAMTASGDPVFVDAARNALIGIYRDDPGISRSGWESWKAHNLQGSVGNGG